MVNINNLINTYNTLGDNLIEIANNIDNNKYSSIINNAIIYNNWFTKDTIKQSLLAIGYSLQKNKLQQWINNYRIKTPNKIKNIGVIMAGNIPLVGFNDFICVLISGNNILAKLSSKDLYLYKIIKGILIDIDKTFENRITLTTDFIKNIDAIIATGSNNSSRYFEYYFSKYPHIIRKNRNSIGIISGNESTNDLQNLGIDIFSYFGLGCRNVSFILVPNNYNFKNMLNSLKKFESINTHTKYYNNYEYQKTIMAMNQIPFLDNENILLKESDNLSSPISVLHYKYYNSNNDIQDFIKNNTNNIQCIVSKTKFDFDTYELGKAQIPELWDYADNIDTLDFLINIK